MDSTLVVGYMIMALSFTIAGHVTKYKILALFSIWPLAVLLFEFSGNMLSAVFTAGLILWNGAYSLGLGGSND